MIFWKYPCLERDTCTVFLDAFSHLSKLFSPSVGRSAQIELRKTVIWWPNSNKTAQQHKITSGTIPVQILEQTARALMISLSDLFMITLTGKHDNESIIYAFLLTLFHFLAFLAYCNETFSIKIRDIEKKTKRYFKQKIFILTHSRCETKVMCA